jgi:hypothetical protein
MWRGVIGEIIALAGLGAGFLRGEVVGRTSLALWLVGIADPAAAPRRRLGYGVRGTVLMAMALLRLAVRRACSRRWE